MSVSRNAAIMSKTPRSFILLALFVLLAATAHAESVTVTWDQNTEPDVTGYVVFWGAQTGVYTEHSPTVSVTSYTVDNLVAGQTYHFAVQAVSSTGLTSPLSEDVTYTVPGGSPTGLTEAQWMAKFSLTDMTGDVDGDGVINRDEYMAGPDPTLPNTWMLAEGRTDPFKARLAITNPGTDQAEITVTFLCEGMTPVVQQYTIPGLSRKTVLMNDVPGLDWVSVSTEISTQRGGVVVERTMTWNGADKTESAHTGKAVSRPSSTWYFAEGDARLFETYLLLANTHAFDVNVEVTYLLDNGQTVGGAYLVPANRRYTVYTNSVPGLEGASFAMNVVASAPINAERAMYFSTSTTYYKGGHDSSGTEAPSTTWFIAEGRTGPTFQEYILLSNPNQAATTATIRYLTPGGTAATRDYAVGPMSRRSILVNEIPGLAYSDVSASITSTLPIVAERSMYWPGTWGQWLEGHNSMALSRIGTKWALAEGETGGIHNAISYILLANPTSQDATVTLTILRDNGLAPIVVNKTVKANSRQTVNSTQVPLGSGETFGAIIESTNGVPIAVERSVYWDGAGKAWIAGTNETGVLLK
jgi:hypothetical protein